MAPTLMKVKGGWRIQMRKGHVYPLLYKTRAAGEERIDQLNRHASTD